MTRLLKIAESPSTEGNDGPRNAMNNHRLELIARSNAEQQSIIRPWKLFVSNLISALWIVVRYLVTLESIVGCSLTFAATIAMYQRVQEMKNDWNGGGMNWWLLTFTVVMPMTKAVHLSFGRREYALRCIESLRMQACRLYTAHATWDWDKGTGRRRCRQLTVEWTIEEKNWLRHADEVLSLLLLMGDELCRCLTLPSYNRARHRVSKCGREEAYQTLLVSYGFYECFLTNRMAKLTLLTETLKRHGLPPNESIRIRQWERLWGTNVEELRLIKTYRTPQALRSFSRIFSVCLPPMYAPFFVQMAMSQNSLLVALTFASVVSLALTALFASIQVLEDPFVGHLALEGIDVHKEFLNYRNELLGARAEFFPNAPELIEQELDVVVERN